MRQLGFALLIAITGLAPASAADLPSRIMTKAPTHSDPAYNWGGWYVGGNVGANWNSANVDSAFVNGTAPIADQQAFAARTTQLGRSGFSGGGVIGYNDQVDRWLFGVEADASYTGLRQSRSTMIPFPSGNAFTAGNAIGSDWAATLRPRAGYIVDHTLLYLTGGLALTDLNFASSYADAAGQTSAANAGKIKLGWVAGAGIEHAFSQNWTAKLEYLYADFGKETVSAPIIGAGGSNALVSQDISPKSNTLRGGFNYHFGSPLNGR